MLHWKGFNWLCPSTIVIVYLFQGPHWIFANMWVCIMETWSNICPKFVKVLFHLSVCESLHQRECLKKKKVFTSTEETNCPLKVPACHMRKRNLGLRNRKTNKKHQAKKAADFFTFFAHCPPHWWWTHSKNWGGSSPFQSRGQYEIILETNERLYIYLLWHRVSCFKSL